MKEIIAKSAVVGIWTIATLELFLIILMSKNYRERKSHLTLFTLLITIGLFVDAFIIGLGAFISEDIIRIISRIRFVSHGLLIPLLFAICAKALNLKKPFSTAVYIFTAIMMVLGFAQSMATVLDITNIAGIARMASVKTLTPKWASTISSILSFGSVIPLMIVGLIIWCKEKTPSLFLSGFLMFAFPALGPATGNTEFIFYISMYGEILMVFFLFMYAINRQNKERK
ncbi:MAG: hypothetical protein Q4B60_08430 [Erysipelotrichaceae bacterium]|nr:hypothetical protein [Erysipelotrichaceae bacterium]